MATLSEKLRKPMILMNPGTPLAGPGDGFGRSLIGRGMNTGFVARGQSGFFEYE